MVPSGWREGRVEELIKGLESGVSVNGVDRPILPNEKGVLKVSAVSYGIFDPLAIKAIESEAELDRAKTNPKKGQIIISRSNTEELVGASAYVEADYPYLFLPDKLWQTISKKTTSIKWLSYLLASEHSRYTLSNLATGTSSSMKNITKGELLGLKVPIPPLPEQRKIAQILSIWDKAISATEALIANSQQQKKSLMQQLLTGKKRFEGFEGEWEEVKLNNICTINPKKPENPKNGTVSFVPMDAVSEDARLLRTEDKQYVNVSKGFTSFTNFDVLIAKITPCFENGKGAYIENLSNGIGFGSTEFHVLRATAKVSSKFIFYISNTSEFRVKGEMNMQGSAGQKRITTDYLRAYRIFIPPSLLEQQKIASVLTAADQEIDTLQQKCNHLKQEKKALMQQLLTGKRRVNV